MDQRTCFVIMPIGDQSIGEVKVTADELRKRYDDLIKEAILRVAPHLDVARADEVALPGSITSDILTRLMHSDLVVADVSYPNPNVFYELGLRHACRPGTIIIRDKEAPTIPFDIAHLRHIEYENSPSGLKQLAEKIGYWIQHFSQHPERPDNQLLELAKLTAYRFQEYAEPEYDEEAAQMEMFEALTKSPQILDLIFRKSSGETVEDSELLRAMVTNPDIASTVFKALVKSGEVSLTSSAKPDTSRKKPAPTRRKKKR